MLLITKLTTTFLVLALGTCVAAQAADNTNRRLSPLTLGISETASTPLSLQPVTLSADQLRQMTANRSSAKHESVIITSRTSSVSLDFGVTHSAEVHSGRTELTTSVVPVFRPPSVTQSKQPIKGGTNQLKSSSSASSLFATKQSPGSIAVGSAEGNLTLTGQATSLYSGHTDPGNHVTNRGFCSWNRAANLTIAEADRRCLAALQRQSAVTERKLTQEGVNVATHTAALVNGTDLWNQSNSAGPQFAAKYKKALEKGLKGSSAYIWARVEAFRNQAGILDASGLFGICSREPYYQNRLLGIPVYSETWRWQCIALDQRRRVRMVNKALQQNLVTAEAKKPKVVGAGSPRPQHRTTEEPETTFIPIALSFNPVPLKVPNVPTPGVNATQLNFGVSVARYRPKPSQPNLPSSPSQLSFDPVPANIFNKVKPASNKSAAASSVNLSQAISAVNHWTPNLKRKPNAGDRIAGYFVTSAYGNRIHPLTGRASFHGGVDLATPSNTLLYAIGLPGSKTNLKCWTDSQGGGLVATMTSPNFPLWKFDALHLSWCNGLTNGPWIQVNPGTIIGGTGNTGHSTGPHLHFQLRDKQTNKRISPTKGYIWWVLTGKKPKSSAEK